MPNRSPVLLLCACLLLVAPPARAQRTTDEADPQSAAGAFAEATKLFEKQEYVGAIEAFQQAYDLRPHFLVLCNIALSYERLGDMVRSAEHYRRCLEEGGDRVPDGESVKNTLRLVEGRISWAEIKSSAGGMVYLDGRPIGPAPQRLAMNPGTHVLEVRKPGTRPATASITARGGEEQTLQLEPQPLPQQEPKIIERTAVKQPSSRRQLSQIWFWGSAGLTATFAIVASVLGAQTLSLQADYEESPSRDLLNRGEDRRLLTNIFWAATAVAAGATTTLFFFTDFGGERAGASRRAATYGLGLRGSF